MIGRDWALAPSAEIPDADQAVSIGPAPIQKIIGFPSKAKHLLNRAVSSHRGALAIVTDAGRDAMDAIVSTADERC